MPGIDLALVNGIDTRNMILPDYLEPYKGKFRPYNQRYIRRAYRFSNGYGASVIPDGGGVWEVFPVKFTGEGIDDFVLCYDCKMSRKNHDMNVPYNAIDDYNLQRLLTHIKSMNSSGNFRGSGIPTDMGKYYESPVIQYRLSDTWKEV